MINKNCANCESLRKENEELGNKILNWGETSVVKQEKELESLRALLGECAKAFDWWNDASDFGLNEEHDKLLTKIREAVK